MTQVKLCPSFPVWATIGPYMAAFGPNPTTSRPTVPTSSPLLQGKNAPQAVIWPDFASEACATAARRRRGMASGSQPPADAVACDKMHALSYRQQYINASHKP